MKKGVRKMVKMVIIFIARRVGGSKGVRDRFGGLNP
jgi:hypothetical protein